MTCKVVDFHPRDLLDIKDPMDTFKGWEEKLVGQYESDKACSYTLVGPEGEVICIFGGNMTQPQTMTCWSVLTPLVKKYSVTFHKSLKFFIEYYWKNLDLLRMQTTIDVDNERAQKQNELLGFKREALLEKFGPSGQDQYIYARLS